MLEYLGLSETIELQDFVKLVSRFFINLFFASAVILGVYKRLNKRTDFVFTYFAFNVVTFSLCFLLRKVPTELGFALGLFAVFGILRYRTEPIGIRNLTYLFVVIGIGILTAVANKKVSLAELVFVDGSLVMMTVMLEWIPRNKIERSTPVVFDNLELLHPSKKSELLEELQKRTGLEITDVEIENFNLLRDTADLRVFYVPRDV